MTPPDDFGWVDRDAYPVVMVHGTPDWSFLWRHLIQCLAPGYRCVAMDHLGFGLSDKPASFGCRPEDHAENVRALIEHLGLRDLPATQQILTSIDVDVIRDLGSPSTASWGP